MLGLRGSPLSKKTHSSSNLVNTADNYTDQDRTAMAPSSTPMDVTDIVPLDTSMSTAKMKGTNDHNGSQSRVEEKHSDSHTQITTSESKTFSTTSRSRTEDQLHFSRDQQITLLRDTVMTTRRKFISEFHHVDEHYIDSTTFGGFLHFLERERLTHMPHRGSKWDRVLKWAEFFALQVSTYERVVAAFVPDSKTASKLIWTACRVLLELGHGNAQALEVAFGAFYRLGLSLSFFLRHNGLLHVSAHLRSEVGSAFKDMLILVRDVTVTYRKKIYDHPSGPVRLDFNELFGRQMESFFRRKNHIVDSMWAYQLGDDTTMDIRELRNWLKPNDKVTMDILRNRKDSLIQRAEYTCEWFQRYLLDFCRGEKDVLVVHGPEGCGKSVLSGWIVERLQRPLAKKSYVTLSCSIYPDTQSESTPLAIAKNLLLQLLETNVGDKILFEKLAHAFHLSTTSADTSKMEETLWAALDIGLKNFDATSDSLMILIDGIDNINGDAKGFMTRFESLSKKHQSLQSIILARTFSTANTTTQAVEIKRDHTHRDMEQVVTHALHGYHHFKDQTDSDQEKIVEQIIQNAQGNFLLVTLVVSFLRNESTHAGFAAALKELPKNLPDLVKKIMATLDLKKPETKLLLSWLLVAQRPLTLAEIKHLYEVDYQKKTIVERKGDIQEDVIRACGLLIDVKDGIVAFRHGAIRSYLRKMQADKTQILPWKDAQDDITKRMLLYSKLSVTRHFQPLCEIPATFDVDDAFKSHSLLEYCVRYWIVHFQESLLHQASGAIQLSPETVTLFPNSTEFVVLEWKCWEYQSPVSKAIDKHNLALRIRQAAFTDNHESVLQSLIICGHFHQRLSNTKEASSYFYRASKLGQKILHQYHTVTITCTTLFLTVTEELSSTTRTEAVTHKEEMLKYIIAASKYQHTITSEVVVRYYELLAQLYVDIHEDDHAEDVWKEIRKIIITRHGKGSEEEKEISKNLVIVLKKDKKKEDFAEYESSIFETITTMEVWDIRRIEMTFKLAMSYETRGELFLAEELYITLWRRLTEHCRQSHSHYGVEIHISVIDIALEYVRFLRRHDRHDEAAGILICVWTEYEDYDFESETILLRLKIVGELMREVGLFSLAISVFKKCWGWFKFHGKHEQEASCEILISESVEEMTASIRGSTTIITTTETVIKEVFESTVTKKTVTKETITICKSLISLHMEKNQWSQAIEVIQRSLMLIWKTVLSGSGTIALPRSFDSDAIDIAINLAICHYRSHHYHEAEEIYVRVYRACRTSCRVDDERLARSSLALIKFYEKHRHWHQMIDVYQELLVEYRSHLGASHPLTIKTLYILGSLCSDHGYGNSLEYYEEIVTVLNGKHHVCHKDAAEAMIVLCREYYEGGKWLKLERVCKTLWETWTHHHHDHKFDAAFIELLYKRYIYVLEHHHHYEYEAIRTLTIQYRDTCIKVFGALSIITITAMTELAQICLRSEKHVQEAITIYEEVITKTTTNTTTSKTVITVSTTTMDNIKKHLVQAYTTVCSHDSTSTTTIVAAIKVLRGRFEVLRKQSGCAHSETLIVFRELILMYKKLKTQESHATITQMLTDTSIEIIVNEKHTTTLYEAAVTLGSIYASADMHEHGLEVIHEMRTQIITGKSTSTKKFGFNIEGKVTKSCYVFLVTLERILQRLESISYSEIMTEILTETTLYEHYSMCIKSETDVAVVLTHAARLRAFLVTRGRLDQISAMEKHVFEIFFKKWGASLTKIVNKDTTLTFLIGLLVQLGVDGRELKFGTTSCIASVETVNQLLNEGKYRKSYEVAQCGFEFMKQQRAYHELENIPYSFALCALLAGKGWVAGKDQTHKAPEPELLKEMMKLSQVIIRDIFKALKESDIDLLRLKPKDLDNIVALLGAQQNYADLEWLLQSLWLSREVHTSWDRSMIIAIGRLLATAHSLSAHHPQALKICDDISYNLRRVWGPLHPQTLAMQELLSQLYTAANHHRDAMAIHEDILRLITEGDDNDNDGYSTDDRVVDPVQARLHLNLLKASHLRLKGWDKSPASYHMLVRALLAIPAYKSHPVFKDAQPAENWSLKEDVGTLGLLVAPAEWRFVATGADASANGARGRTPRMGMKRASSNWGMSFLGDLVGEEEEDEGYEHEATEQLGMGGSMTASYRNGGRNANGRGHGNGYGNGNGHGNGNGLGYANGGDVTTRVRKEVKETSWS